MRFLLVPDGVARIPAATPLQFEPLLLAENREL